MLSHLPVFPKMVMTVLLESGVRFNSNEFCNKDSLLSFSFQFHRPEPVLKG